MFLRIFIFLFISVSAYDVYAQKKAKVISPSTELYGEASFDSEVIRAIDPNETFIISNKTYGPFYKVKLKDGTIGYIPDTELDIEGVGVFEPKNFETDSESLKSKKKKKSGRSSNDDDYDEDTEDPHLSYFGLTLQAINYHEDTMGGVQVADLTALGFKYQPLPGNYDSELAYEFFFVPRAPEYYAQKTGGASSGTIFWGTAQISNVNGINARTSLRYGAGPFLKYSYFAIDAQNKKYSLQDITIGLDFGAGVLLHSRYMTLDFGLRYFWDKKPYGGFGISFLF